MKEIPLTQGQVALVDDEDYPYLAQFRWHAVRTPRSWYANHSVKAATGCLSIRMQWLIMGKNVDHKNGNGLDNRRENLRKCSKAQNNRNQQRIPTQLTPYKGLAKKVYRFRTMWQSSIRVEGHSIYLGLYDTPEGAALAYNGAAKLYHREFASFNKVPGTSDTPRE